MLLPAAQRQRHGLRRRLKTDERGVALVEFALVLPLVMLLLLGAVEFGKAFTMWIDETHLANQAARYAAVNNWKDSDGVSHTVSSDVTAFENFIKADGDTQELRDSFDDPTDPTNGVHVCFPPGSTGAKGDAIRINVKATYTFLGFLAGLPGLSGDKALSAHSVMRIEADGSSGYDPSIVSAHPCP